MNDVNFLPARYIERRARKLRRYRQVLMVALAVATLAGWWFVQHQRTDALRRYAAHLDTQVLTAKQKLQQIALLRQEHEALAHQIRVQRDLAMPLEHTRVLALLADRMPGEVGLLSMQMTTHRPKPMTRQAQAQAEQKKKHRGQTAPPSTRPQPDEFDIRLRGIAPSDAVLTDFVARLEASELFSEVRLYSSVPGELGELMVREFDLRLRVPLDRRFKPHTGGEEVADAR